MTPEELELARWTLRGLFWLGVIFAIAWVLAKESK